MPKWTEEQQKAIYKKENNILVAAAAGSGKTAVLVERIINKIINENIDIDRLLVVTFTNAAASEMRERILNALYKKIDETPNEQLQNNLRKQITLLNKANICTIDSFCLDVIHNNFYKTDISPNFRIADNAEIDLLKQEILEELFEEKYESQNKNFEELIKIYTSYRDDTPLKDLILKIYTYIESSPYPEKWLNNQIEKFNIQNTKIDFIKTIWGEILIEEVKQELIDDINTLKAELTKLEVDSKLEKFAKIYSKDIENLETILVNLDSWDKLYILSNNLEFSKWPISKEISEEKENAKNIRDTVKKKLKNKLEKIFITNSEEALNDIAEMYEILKKLEELIIDFKEHFSAKKKEKNIVDFTDVEHFALQILENEEVAKKYKDKFVEIAIDEYQDSNLVQEFILKSISNGKNIYMVGDVKQSIYKFRQAVPKLFLDKYKNYKEVEENIQKDMQLDIIQHINQDLQENDKQNLKNGIKIKLFKNFRSRENILNFTNIIFANIMSENLGEINYTEEEYLNLGANFEKNENQELKTEIDIIDIKQKETDDLVDNEKELKQIQNNYNEKIVMQNEDEKTDDSEQENILIEDIELEAKFVAQKINELIKNKFQVYDNKKERFRDIKYKDIVILLRNTKIKAPIFEKQLINQNIPVFSDSSQEYLASYEIQTIMSILKIIDNPMQDIPLIMVLKSPIYNFTDDELVEIRLCDKQCDFYTVLLKAKLSVQNNLKIKIENFLEQIEDFRNKNEYLALDELIWNIYEKTNFFQIAKSLPNGVLREANLKILFERAKQYEKASFKGLFSFINFIEKIHLGSGDLSSAKLIGENEDVVRIMSIHKSKGLEFPIVFLCNTNTNFNTMDLNNDILMHQDLGIGVKYINYDMQIKYDTLTKLAIKSKLYDEILSEEMRILYVALTRAKEKIYITGINKNYEESNTKMQNLVDIYKMQNGKINPILIKKYKNYLDWILLVNKYNKEEMQNLSKINIIKKDEFLKYLNKLEKNEKSNETIENNKSDKIKIEENQFINVNYQYKTSTKIPTKTSVTDIVSKDSYKLLTQNINNNSKIEKEYDSDLEKEELEIKFNKPKFLNKNEQEKISASTRGTLVHLCMKNLDFSKEYVINDIKELIKTLQNKQIITKNEADSINIYKILAFTKSKIWKELKYAKEIHKEEPFYINIPAKNIYKSENNKEEITENILVQGIIDLYYINKNDELILLDYKTDYVETGAESKLIEKHKKQLMLYKEALENALNKKVEKVYIYSVCLEKEIELI